MTSDLDTSVVKIERCGAFWVQVILRMSKELPLVVEYRIQDMGNLSFYLVRISAVLRSAFSQLHVYPALEESSCWLELTYKHGTLGCMDGSG